MTRRSSRLLFLAGLLVLCGCGKGRDKPLLAIPASPTVELSSDGIVSRLPAGTVAYVRLEGVGNLEERLSALLPVHLTDAGPIRAKLDSWYAAAIREIAQ